jgi:hypothetical protein
MSDDAEGLDEGRQLEEIWEEMARDVLSCTRIDPATKGAQFELFQKFEGEITAKHLSALKSSDYGRRFVEFLGLWKSRPVQSGWEQLPDAAEFYMRMSREVYASYREIKKLEKDGRSLSDEEVLRNAKFLNGFYWDRDSSNFYIDGVGELLNQYLSFGIRWRFFERTILSICVRRAIDVSNAREKPLSETLSEAVFGDKSVASVYAALFLRLFGMLVPKLVWFAIIVFVFLWASANASSSAVLSGLGFVFVAIAVVGASVYYGTDEIRRALVRLSSRPYPGWFEGMSFVDADLHGLDRTVNNYKCPHVNLRLVREQLARLQSTKCEMPVQLITLIDRAISENEHYW